MKRLYWLIRAAAFITITVLFCVIGIRFWSKTVLYNANECRIAISLDKMAYIAEEPVRLQASTEISEELPGAKIHPEAYMSVHLTRDGKPVRRTRYGRSVEAMTNNNALALDGEALRRENPLRQELLISRHFDLSMTGKYVVNVSRKIYVWQNGLRHEESVKSADVEFEIKHGNYGGE